MKVRFLVDVDISGKYEIPKGGIHDAEECGDYIAIRMIDDATAMVPKSEINNIFEIVED